MEKKKKNNTAGSKLVWLYSVPFLEHNIVRFYQICAFFNNLK